MPEAAADQNSRFGREAAIMRRRGMIASAIMVIAAAITGWFELDGQPGAAEPYLASYSPSG
jgi:hypothetical protein